MSEAPKVRRGPPPRDSLPAAVWTTDIRIRFSHCDPAGIVYFARYFDLMNGVVEDWFSGALGLDYAEFIGPRRVGLGYASCQADFAAPGFMGDHITFAVLVDRIGGASLTLRILAYRGQDPVLSAGLTIVTTSLVEHRAIPIPGDLRSAIERYQGDTR